MLHYFVPMFKSIRIGFRILYKHKKEAAVWKHLLHLMKKGKVSPWINEHEKMVSARIIFGGKAYSVHFLLSKETLTVRVHFMDNFPEHVVKDLLVLAGHINNVLIPNFIVVHAEDHCIYIEHCADQVVYMVDPAKIEEQLLLQLSIAEDVEKYFVRMIQEQEDPVFIFSDFMQSLREGRKSGPQNNLLDESGEEDCPF